MCRMWKSLVVALLACAVFPRPALAFDQPFKLIPGGDWDVDQGPIPFVLEPNGVDDITDGSDLEALRGAFRAWSCVEGVKVRFEEQPGPGPGVADLSDHKNTLYWDETGRDGLGPATLGVTIGDANPGSKREQADIIFNGSDSTWSTDDRPSAVDVGSIALHEIGHFIGLDHPCDGSAPNETNCNGPDRAIMTPVWGGGVQRTPLPDDEAGVKNLYPAAAGDTSTCTGPFRKGEKCSCDGDCVEGLLCAGVGADQKTCAETCAADHVDCGAGFACTLDAPQGNEKAPGICVKVKDGPNKPTGAVCARSSECASGSCTLLFELARQICEVPCGADSDCDAGGSCFKGFCLGSADHLACQQPPSPGGCGCAMGEPLSSSSSPSQAALFAGSLAALAGLSRWLASRRRGRRRARA